ncbi:TPA: hypothetical protein ACTUXY_003348 [Legionella pneumophila]
MFQLLDMKDTMTAERTAELIDNYASGKTRASINRFNESVRQLSESSFFSESPMPNFKPNPQGEKMIKKYEILGMFHKKFTENKPKILQNVDIANQILNI